MKNNYKGYIHVDRVINPDTQDFLEKILDKEPNERLSSLDALEHHVFLQTDDEEENFTVPVNYMNSWTT